MATATYLQRRGQLKTYFDETAAEAWARLTSNDPVGRIRESVRRGRLEMGELLLGWLPDCLDDQRLLDAGCGTGALAVALATRGASVHGVELSPRLIELARSRTPGTLPAGRLSFAVGDMLDPALGRFDYVVAMDSLIHYRAEDAVAALAELATRTRRALLFTIAPRTAPLAIMHALGRLFPREQRAPAIEPVAIPRLVERLAADPRFHDWKIGRQKRIGTGFYTSEAIELRRR